MPRLGWLIATLLAAATLAACAKRTQLAITAYDTTSGETVGHVSIAIINAWKFPMVGPSGRRVMTRPDAPVETDIATYNSVYLFIERPGYQAPNYPLGYFSTSPEWVSGRFGPVLEPVEGVSGWSLRVPIERREHWGMIIHLPERFKGLFVMEQVGAPESDVSLGELVRCHEATLSATRHLRVPIRGYLEIRAHYPDEPFLSRENDHIDKGVSLRLIAGSSRSGRSLWFVGTEKNAEKIEASISIKTPDGNMKIDPAAYNALVERVCNQPL